MLDKHRCTQQLAQWVACFDEKMDRYAVLFLLLPLINQAKCFVQSWCFLMCVLPSPSKTMCAFAILSSVETFPRSSRYPATWPFCWRQCGSRCNSNSNKYVLLVQSCSIHKDTTKTHQIPTTPSPSFVPPGAATEPRSQLSTARTWLGPVRALGRRGVAMREKVRWIKVFFVWSSSGQTFFELEVWIDSARDWRLGRGTLRARKSSANWNSQRPLAQPVLSRETGQAYTWLPLDFQRFGCGCMISTFLNRPNCYSGLEFSAWDNNRPISSFRQDYI